jgi:hypothetical protein
MLMCIITTEAQVAAFCVATALLSFWVSYLLFVGDRESFASTVTAVIGSLLVGAAMVVGAGLVDIPGLA